MDERAREPNGKSGRRPQVVVVTGGTAGVGRAVASAFAARGDHVAVLARGEDGLAATKAEIEALGSIGLALSVDVADSAAVDEAAATIERELGPIDVWVNNAMVSVFSPFKEMNASEFERVTRVTYLGAVHGTMAALRYMLPRDHGVIVQVGSALAYRSIPLQAAYCGAKAGIRGFTDSLRCELLHDHSKVRVTMVHMPALNTPQFEWTKSRLPKKAQPVPPIYQPEVAARAVVWASEHRRRELYVGWPTIKAIVLGAKLAPGVGDRVLARTGYDAQQTEEPVDVGAPNDLRAPVVGHHRAHGSFDDRARPRSIALFASTHRAAIALGVLALAGAAFAIVRS